MSIVRQERRIAAGILGILLGQFGIHKFLIGYPREGLIMLALTVVGWITACIGGGFLAAGMALIGFIEGIIYLVKTDHEFYSSYVARYRGWF